MKNETKNILEAIEAIKLRELKLVKLIPQVKSDVADEYWNRLVRFRRYRNQLEKELNQVSK